MEQVLNKPVTPVLHFSRTVEGPAPKICDPSDLSPTMAPPTHCPFHTKQLRAWQQSAISSAASTTQSHWMRKPGVWCRQSSFPLGALKEPTCSMSSTGRFLAGLLQLSPQALLYLPMAFIFFEWLCPNSPLYKDISHTALGTLPSELVLTKLTYISSMCT